MGNNGMNVNGFAKANGVKPNVAGPNEHKLSEQEKIIIDFRALDQDGDLHVSIDETLRHQVDEYVRTGKLPEGKTVAEFLMDVQKAVEKYAGDDKRLNIDEYGAMLKSGVEIARPSEGQVPQGSDGYAYSEWGEVDGNGNVSFGASYSPRAEANKNEVAEINEWKEQSKKLNNNDIYAAADSAHKNTEIQRNQVNEMIMKDPNLNPAQKEALIAANEASHAAIHTQIEVTVANQVGFQEGFEAGIRAAQGKTSGPATTPQAASYRENPPEDMY